MKNLIIDKKTQQENIEIFICQSACRLVLSWATLFPPKQSTRNHLNMKVPLSNAHIGEQIHPHTMMKRARNRTLKRRVRVRYIQPLDYASVMVGGGGSYTPLFLMRVPQVKSALVTSLEKY